MATLDALDAAIAALIQAAGERLQTNVVAELQAATPVDTGFAASSWIPAVPFDLPGGGVISNNAKYIRRLNAGWSKQAAAGFVRVAIAQGVAIS